MITYPCAKINLGLNIVGKRSDGYHNLETVFYPINLRDRLEIEELPHTDGTDKPCTLVTDGISIAGPTTDNLVVKAYNTLKSLYPTLPNIAVRLTKNIPSQAGMGGGSSDCAYTVTAINKIFNLGMSIADMQQLTAELGADCPFFVNPEPSYATGIGEQLTPIDVDLSGYTIGIVKPPIMISTREAFAHVVPQRPRKCCKDIVRQPIETWKDELVNDFEQSIAANYPMISEIKQELYGMGAVYAAMSGSGSALYGIFKQAPEDFGKTFKDYFIAIV